MLEHAPRMHVCTRARCIRLTHACALELKQADFLKHERTTSLPTHFGADSPVAIEPVALQKLAEQLRADRAHGESGVPHRLMGLRASPDPITLTPTPITPPPTQVRAACPTG